MNDTSSDDILLLKQRLAEQEALIHALQEKLSTSSSIRLLLYTY
jgi:transposase